LRTWLTRSSTVGPQLFYPNMTGGPFPPTASEGEAQPLKMAARPELRWSYSGIFLVCSIQVHPHERLLTDWVCSGLGCEHMTSHHIIPHGWSK
jgi:hypothetical protein